MEVQETFFWHNFQCDQRWIYYLTELEHVKVWFKIDWHFIVKFVDTTADNFHMEYQVQWESNVGGSIRRDLGISNYDQPILHRHYWFTTMPFQEFPFIDEMNCEY